MPNVAALLCRLFRERRVAEVDEAADRERPLRAFPRNSARRATQHLSRKVITFTGFTVACAMAPIFAGASRAGPTFCDPKSR